VVRAETLAEYRTPRSPLLLGQIEHAGAAANRTEEERQELWSLHRRGRVGVDLCRHTGRDKFEKKAAHWP